MPKFLFPTVRLKGLQPIKGGGRQRLLSFLATEDEGNGVSRVLIHPLGCDSTPAWVSVEALRPLMNNVEVIQP